MRIGEVARRSGVAPSRIRFYETRGLLPAAARRNNGYRDYPLSMVVTLQFIENAQALGFSLREIGAAIPANGNVKVAVDVILPALEQKLADVDAHIAASKALRACLVKLIATQRECVQPDIVASQAMAALSH